MGNEIDKILRDLKRKVVDGDFPRPRGLSRGLNIRLERVGGMWMLAAWREKAAPSDTEMAVLADAIRRLDDPQIIMRDQAVGVNGRFYGLRLYWPDSPMVVSWLRPAAQKGLFDGDEKEGQQRHNNYQE